MRRLNKFSVKGLFDLYNHEVSLNTKDRITAIIGPNGVGKTICLKLIDALFNRKYSVFNLTKFKSCQFEFDDGTVIFAHKEPLQLDLTKSDEEAVPTVSFEVRTPDGEISTWQPSVALKKLSKRASSLDHYIPFLTQIAPGAWRHDRTGEKLSVFEITERYSHRIPRSFTAQWRREEASKFTAALEGTKCHLIETQRLLVMPDSDEDLRMRHGMHAIESAQLAVERKSQTLSRQIQKVLADYASLSQSLDRTFPSRIVHTEEVESADRKEIEAQLAQLESRRKALEGTGILEPELGSVTRVPENMDSALQRVISIYLGDTNKKLNIFSNLQNKIQVFEELIKKRFLDKQITITKAAGLEVTSINGSPIPLSALSSGEQHQLVLIFELLFETDMGDLILIDEPELSLHVAWQKSFIDDLIKIIDANPFDSIIATHSPVLIGHHYNLAVELGGPPYDQVD